MRAPIERGKPARTVDEFGNEPVDLRPDEDFTPAAAARREASKRLDFRDTQRELNRKIATTQAAPAPNGVPVPIPRDGQAEYAADGVPFYQRRAQELLERETARRSITGFDSLPIVKEIANQAAEQGVTLESEDLRNLVDFGIINSAADRIVLAAQAGDRVAARNVYLTLEETDPVMAAIVPAVVEQKIAQAVQDPTTAETIVQGAMDAIGVALSPFVAAYEWMSEGQRAGAIQLNEDAQTPGVDFGPLGFARGFLSADRRAQARKGQFNEAYIQQLRDSGEYDPLEVDIAVDVARAAESGDPDAIINIWQTKYYGDEAAARVFRDIMYSRGDASVQELLRQIGSASLGDLGDVAFGSADTSAVYDPARGSELRETAASVTGFGVSLATDPTLFLGRVGNLYKAARWGLERLAPGAPASAVLSKARFGRLEVSNPAYRYFDNFASDLNRLDDLEKRAAAAATAGRLDESASLQQQAASFRNRMTRQYDEMPEDLIEDFRGTTWRDPDGKFTVETLAAAIDDMNDAYVVALGGVSDKLAAQGATQQAIKAAEQELLAQKSFYGRVSGKNQKRTALVPRMSLAAQVRKDAVNRLAFAMIPQAKATALVSQYLDQTGQDAALFTQALSDSAVPFGTANRNLRWTTGTGWVDSTGRLFSSIPTLTTVSVTSAEDTVQVYRYARLFFPRRTAELIADAFRRGDEGSRRLLLSGLVRSGAASRGLTLTAKEADGFVRQLDQRARALITGTMEGERYGVTVPVGAMPSERASMVAGRLQADAAAAGVQPAWQGGPALFHGTSQRFPNDELAELPFVAQEQNFVGAGFYTTAKREVAEQGYTKKGNGSDPFLYAVRWTGAETGRTTPTILDGDAPAPAVLREAIERAVRGDGWLANNLFDDAPIFAALDDATTSTVDLFRAFRRSMARHVDEPLYRYDVSDMVTTLSQALNDAGYDAIKHVGGRYTRKNLGEHDVFVWLNTRDLAVRDAGLRALDDAAEASDDVVLRSLSADSSGIEHAIHLDQTADRVALPTLKDFEDLRGSFRVGTGMVAGKAVDYWSIGTLFGLRFSMRNAIEEVGLYWLTGGKIAELYKGRKASQAIRRVRPRIFIQNVNGKPEVVLRTSLGMFANKAEWASKWMRNKGYPEWMAELVFRGADEDALKAAGLALAKGDTEAFASLAIQSLAKQKVFGFSTNLTTADEQAAFRYLVDSAHGMSLLDNIAEASPYLNSGGFPAYASATHGIDDAVPGIEFGKLREFRYGDYGNVRPVGKNEAGKDVFGLAFWWREMQRTLVGDGDIGEAAVRLMDRPDLAKKEIARIIREDKTFRYKERFSRIRSDADIDQFAADYFENVFQHFTTSEGKLNVSLRAKFLTRDADGKMVASFWQEIKPEDLADLGDDAVTTAKQMGLVKARVTRADLADIPVKDRPEFIFGREVIQEPYIPMPMNEASLLSVERAYGWMGRQNARISREPVFLANYLDQYKQTAEARRMLATQLAAKRGGQVTDADIALADRVYARQAMDNAYSLTLSYVDNPANRSNLAWKIRNVARYYRASEDFYRRAKRTAMNSPVALWKGALTYQLLGDYGFTYTNDDGEQYFAYPGNQILQNAITKVGSGLFGINMQQMVDLEPFSLTGRLLGVAPSTDPNQALPSFAGPLTAPLAAVFTAFPHFEGVRSLTLGSYSQNTGNALADAVAQVLPAGVQRVLRTSDPEWVNSQMSQAGLDTIALMTAEGMLDRLTVDGKPLTDAEGNVMNPADVDVDAFKQTDQYRYSQAISMSLLITKIAGGWALPAAPQGSSTTASDFAKRYGIDSMDDAFKDLLDVHREDPNGYERALSEFYAMKVPGTTGDGFPSWASMLPFTTSMHKVNPDKTSAGLAGVRATEDWLKWMREPGTADLRSRYADVYQFLAPRTGEFSWPAWNMMKNIEKLQVRKTEDEGIRDLFAMQGRITENQIRRDYERQIAEASPARAAELVKERDAQVKAARSLNPYWLADTQRQDSRYADANLNRVLSRTKDMLQYLRKRDGKLSQDAQLLESAIDVYTDYKGRASGLVGRAQDRKATKDALIAEMGVQLEAIKSMSDPARQFIEAVLEADPDFTFGVQ